MVKVQLGVPHDRFGHIEPYKMKCLECETVFNYPYCDWAGNNLVILCCPGCRKVITEYVNYPHGQYDWNEGYTDRWSPDNFVSDYSISFLES